MYKLRYAKRFRKDLRKRVKDTRFPLQELQDIVGTIAKGSALDITYRNHRLSGDWTGCYECHVRPDLLLIYRIREKEYVVELLRLGSHAELF